MKKLATAAIAAATLWGGAVTFSPENPWREAMLWRTPVAGLGYYNEDGVPITSDQLGLRGTMEYTLRKYFLPIA